MMAAGVGLNVTASGAGYRPEMPPYNETPTTSRDAARCPADAVSR
jgi:hypothetical protein